MNGNELIVKGALEAGVSLITGYPGSPIADVFTICEENGAYLLELGVEAMLTNNEAQGAAMLNGARGVPGARAMVVMKSVGAYVALDGLAIANSSKPAPGAASIVVVGDDPSLTSTQVGADSRSTLSGARIPVVEPSGWQEMKDAIGWAFELSEKSGLVVGVMVTTMQADGGGVVELQPNLSPQVGPKHRVTIDTDSIPSEMVSLPPHSLTLEEDMVERRIPLLHQAAAALGLSKREGPQGSGHRFGFVVSGASHVLLYDALRALGLDGEVPILRLALTSPIDPEPVRRLADDVDEIVVMEERTGWLEEQVRTAVEGRRQGVWGKKFPDGRKGFPEVSGLDPDAALAAVCRLVEACPDAFSADVRQRAERHGARRKELANRSIGVVARTPTYCAGCPHRGTNSPMLEIRKRFQDPEYMKRVHNSATVDVIAHGGIGCYSMAFLPPFEEMHNLSAMGLGGATGAGAAPLVTNRHYTLVGDGTFFHGEMSTMANAIKARQDILYIVLDNKNTAMTGHQGTPASDVDLLGRPQQPLEIERIIAAMEPAFLARSNPDDRDGHLALIEKALLMQGTRVIIADKECAITSGRRERRRRAEVVKERGYLPEITRFNVVQEVCENCRECAVATGCPGLEIVDTPLGEKIGIDLDTCVDDGYCAAIKACPSFEKVTITRRAKPDRSATVELVAPEDPVLEGVGTGGSRIYLAGVGGMGIGVVARILTEAAARAWAGVDVYHKKGMAQRGGGVFSHIVLHDGSLPHSPMLPLGGADLVMGLDGLEGARALAYASPDRTAAVLSTDVQPTATMLMGRDQSPEDVIERGLRETRPDGLLATDFAAACHTVLGERIYANVAMLGAAYQRGWLLIPREDLEQAIRDVTGGRSAANLRAFLLGRMMASQPLPVAPDDDAAALIAQEEGWMRGARAKAAFRAAIARAEAMGLGEDALRMLAPRLPEIIVWGGEPYATRYLDLVERVKESQPALVPTVIHNLHRAMAIKDEVFVAYQLTSEKKYARDRERFGIDPARGDRLSYEHLNRPAFDVLGRHIEFDLRTRDWMLAGARRMRVLRRLMPAWHRRERAFRDWYIDEVVEAVVTGRVSGGDAEEVLRLPETVTGFRGVRYPKEDAAYERFREAMEK
jgi:indolepyruvate ferredoxin oxidoreductase